MTEQNEVAKKPDNLPATITEKELALSFGGPEPDSPLDIVWPNVKMTKTDVFLLDDDSTIKELSGHIIYAQRSRAFWEIPYGDGNDTPPDCGSSDLTKPDSGDSIQNESCLSCEKSKWYKNDKKENCLDCSVSLNIIFLQQGKTIPCRMRIRSTSIGKGSDLSKFFTNCLNPDKTDFALNHKFQTVQVKLTLKEVKIKNKPSSIIEVEKIKTLTMQDELLATLMTMHKSVIEQFKVVHQQDDESIDVASDNDNDDIPI